MTELVTNGTFDSATTGWSPTTGVTLSISSGTLVVTDNETGGVNDAGAQTGIAITASQKYTFSADALDSNNEGWRISVLGDVSGSLFNQTGTGASLGVGGTITAGASDSTFAIFLYGPQTSPLNGVSTDYDNVSLQAVAAARKGAIRPAYPRTIIIGQRMYKVRSRADEQMLVDRFLRGRQR